MKEIVLTVLGRIFCCSNLSSTDSVCVWLNCTVLLYCTVIRCSGRTKASKRFDKPRSREPRQCVKKSPESSFDWSVKLLKIITPPPSPTPPPPLLSSVLPERFTHKGPTTAHSYSCYTSLIHPDTGNTHQTAKRHEVLQRESIFCKWSLVVMCALTDRN